MKKLVFSLAVAVGALSMVAEAEVPTRAYIQEGLIAHWDGIENAGAGKEHAETSANWVDLKQGAGIKSNATGDSFDGRYFIAANVARTTSQHLSSAEPLTEATFEAFSQPLSIIATKAFHNQLISFKSIGSLEFDSTLGGFSASAFMSDEASGTTPCSFDSGYGDLSEIVAAGALQTYAARIATGSCRGSVNGEPRQQTEGRNPTEVFVARSTETKLSFGGSNLKMKTGSLRVYNRQLSDAELFHNHKIDRARFEDEETWVRLSGDKLQYRIRVTCDARLGAVSVNGGEAQSGTIDLWVDEDGADTTLAFTATERVREFRGWKGANVSEAAAKELTVTVSPLIMAIEPLVWSGKTHSIPTDFASVAEASADDDVLDGDTLILEDGTYTFDQIKSKDVIHAVNNGNLVTNNTSHCVILNRPLKLVGSSPENVVLDCGGYGGLFVDHPDAQVSNLTITNFMMKSVNDNALNVRCGKVDHIVVDGLGVQDVVSSNNDKTSPIYGAPGAVFEDCVFKRMRSEKGDNSHFVLSAYGSVFRRVTMQDNNSCDFVYLSANNTGYRTRFEDCLFEGNFTKSNQAYFQGKEGDFVNCRIVGNAPRTGAVNIPLFNIGGSWTLDRCVITGNTCNATSPLFDMVGVSTRASASKMKLINCLVANNLMKGGSVIRLKDFASYEIVQSTIADNKRIDACQPVGFSGEVKPDRSASVRLVNSIFWNNTANGVVNEFAESYPYTSFVVSNCCFSTGSTLTGENVTYLDPDFVAADAGDYHLGHGSSCLDVGAELPDITDDLDGKTRPQDGTGDGVVAWDIGCYEVETPTDPLVTAVTLFDAEGVLPHSTARLSVKVTGLQTTGLTYEWWAICDANGTVTTNVVTGVGADYTFTDLPLGRCIFASVVRNDQGDAVTNVTDKVFLSLADTAYVSTTGNNVWPYATPETAALDLEDAVAVARNVRVLPGTYTFAHRTDAVTGSACLAAINRGAFVLGESDPSRVVIDCGRKGGFVVNHPQALVAGMTFVNSQIDTDTTSTLDIQKGSVSNVVVCGSETAARPMPFVYVGEDALATELVVTNCLVTTGSSTQPALVRVYGGRLRNSRIVSCDVNVRALRTERTTASVRSYLENVSVCNNTFGKNPDKCIFMESSDAVGLLVRDNTVADSTKTYIFSMGGSRVESSRFVGNVGRGTIICEGAPVGGSTTLRNSLVQGNTCASIAAISTIVNGTPRAFTVESCTVVGNTATATAAAAGGVRGATKDKNGATIVLLNTIVYGNTVDGTPNDVGTPDANIVLEPSYSCFSEAALYPAANNLSADPLLKAGGKLTSGSPCIGTGLAQDWHATGFDLDGRKRVSGRGIDLGCFEFCSTPLVIIIR